VVVAIHLLLFVSAIPILAQGDSDVSGAAVYAKRCAMCHDQNSDRIPSRKALEQMTALQIRRALDSGVMMSIAYPMSQAEREVVASYLGKSGGRVPPPPQAFCQDRTVKVSGGSPFIWNGWSPSITNTRFQTQKAAGLNIDQVKNLKLKWAFGFEGDVVAFSQPAVIGDEIFVGSAGGVVYALRAETGCIQWTHLARGPVRQVIVAPIGEKHAVLFGDLTGWFYELQAESGELLWEKHIEEHDAARLTGTPVAYEGTVYVPVASWEESRSHNPKYQCCTFRGNLVALRVSDGDVIWRTYTVPEPTKNGKERNGVQGLGPSGAGIWSAPTLDLKRKLIYAGTGNNYSPPATSTSDAVLAVDMASGKIVWSTQVYAGDVHSGYETGPDHDFGSSAMLVKIADGRDLLVAGCKDGIVYALDPDRNGKIIWQARVGIGVVPYGGVLWGTATDGNNVYASTSDMAHVEIPAGSGSPESQELDPTKGGGLAALRLSDGGKVWYFTPKPCYTPGCSPAQPGALTVIPDVVFSGSMDGHIRAFSTKDGTVLWDFDTLRDFDTINKVKAKGGAIDGPGAVVVNGMVFVNSGYGRYGGLPGNVLLAFSPEGK
jgi:polyvinyl alcohol dehydrogenase (cytochrome)